MDSLTVWGSSIPREWLSRNELEYLAKLPKALPPVEWLFKEIDRIWCECGLDSRLALDSDAVAKFYSHPVWLANGLFTASDPLSKRHRVEIARYLSECGAKRIADYGGGFGELGCIIAQRNCETDVTIIEPYPSKIGLERIRSQVRVRVQREIADGGYDAIVAQDVLEHVEDPISLAALLAGAVRERGKLVFANCFYPVVKCHLPSTFYLRHTFHYVMSGLGLKYVGRVDGAPHAQIYERVGAVSLRGARKIEKIFRLVGPVLNRTLPTLARVKRSL